jgi:hypothetical protein
MTTANGDDGDGKAGRLHAELDREVIQRVAEAMWDSGVTDGRPAWRNLHPVMDADLRQEMIAQAEAGIQKFLELGSNTWQTPAAAQPADYAVIDIETADAPEEAIIKAFEAWKPDARTKDLEKIATQRLEAQNRIREKAALLDAAPIICIGCKGPGFTLIFDGMQSTPTELPGWTVVPTGTERGMLIAFRMWLDSGTDPDTLLIGQNIYGWDLPKLRGAYARHRLRLPQCLQPRLNESERQPVSDLQRLYCNFSVQHPDQRPSLDEIAAGLNIPRHKHITDGSQVPAMYKRGEYQLILSYCALDCVVEEQAYLRMTSIHMELE